jgi:hypothetical protein
LLEEGQGIISLILEPLQLTGGKYFVEVRLTDMASTTILATQSSKWFFVSDPTFFHEDNRGVFVPNRRWSHRTFTLPQNGTNVLD